MLSCRARSRLLGRDRVREEDEQDGMLQDEFLGRCGTAPRKSGEEEGEGEEVVLAGNQIGNTMRNLLEGIRADTTRGKQASPCER